MQQRLEALESAVGRLAEGDVWRKLLDAHVPAGEPVAVLTEPESLPSDALGRLVASVPTDASGSAAGVARLETQRIQGVRFVLVPAAAGEAVQRDVHLAEHLRAHYRVVGLEPEVGMVFEARSRTATEEEETSLGALIDRLQGDRFTPILDWTSLGMERALPGRPLFEPVAPGAPLLPYFDGTIDLVLVDDAERMDEAARVAAGAAVLVAADDTGEVTAAAVRRKRLTHSAAPTAVRILVATHADDDWLGRLSNAVAGHRAVEVCAATEPITAALTSNGANMVVAERGVAPLPGCIEAAESLLTGNQQIGGVAVKLFTADGSLEAAGGAAFADGSIEAIAEGAPASAPWHEYVRPVAAAVGLVVLRSAAARQCLAAESASAFDLAGLSAHLWSSGWELSYQPHAAAVRVLAQTAEPGAWPDATPGLPPRPHELDDASWRRLLANDLVGAAR
jgi:hypothetical protein